MIVPERPAMDKQKDRVVRTGIDISATTYKDYDLVVMNNIAQIVDRGIAGPNLDKIN